MELSITKILDKVRIISLRLLRILLLIELDYYLGSELYIRWIN